MRTKAKPVSSTRQRILAEGLLDFTCKKFHSNHQSEREECSQDPNTNGKTECIKVDWIPKDTDRAPKLWQWHCAQSIIYLMTSSLIKE